MRNKYHAINNLTDDEEFAAIDSQRAHATGTIGVEANRLELVVSLLVATTQLPP